MLIDKQRSDQLREAIGIRNPHSFQIVVVPNRMLLPAFFSDSGGPDRVLVLSVVVFDDGAVTTARSSFRNCIGSKRILLPAFIADSGGPNKRNAMKNERKFSLSF